MSKIDIQDDFLNPNYFKNLKNLFLSEQVNWTYSDVISYEDELYASKIDNFQFTHLVYFDDAPVSPHYNDLIEFINEIKVASTCKIKVNMNPKTDEIIVHGFHNDMVYKCKRGAHSTTPYCIYCIICILHSKSCTCSYIKYLTPTGAKRSLSCCCGFRLRINTTEFVPTLRSE